MDMCASGTHTHTHTHTHAQTDTHAHHTHTHTDIHEIVPHPLYRKVLLKETLEPPPIIPRPDSLYMHTNIISCS